MNGVFGLSPAGWISATVPEPPGGSPGASRRPVRLFDTMDAQPGETRLGIFQPHTEDGKVVGYPESAAGHKALMDQQEGRAQFRELFLRHGGKVYNFAYRLSGNDQDARDLVQEAFTRALRHYDRFDPAKSFDSWIFRILHNIYLDQVRRYAHKHTVSYDAPAQADEGSWIDVFPGKDVDPAAALTRKEDDAFLQKALDRLPVEYKTAVVLCDIEGLSYENISRVMVCPIGTVRSRIHHGRQLLRKIFLEFQSGANPTLREKP